MEAFIRKFGYADKNDRPDRLNFGGVHRAGERQPSTGLTLWLTGYDAAQGKITDAGGAIALVSDAGEAGSAAAPAALVRALANQPGVRRGRRPRHARRVCSPAARASGWRSGRMDCVCSRRWRAARCITTPASNSNTRPQRSRRRRSGASSAWRRRTSPRCTRRWSWWRCEHGQPGGLPAISRGLRSTATTPPDHVPATKRP